MTHTQKKPLQAPRPKAAATHRGTPSTGFGPAAAPPPFWLDEWLFSEPEGRAFPRESAPGLSARLWTGDTLKAHIVRDVSASGIYVVTEERWLPGTLIRMSLSKLHLGHEPAECSITIQARVVRSGEDGVGLEFVFDVPRMSLVRPSTLLDRSSSEQLQSFLTRLKNNGR